MSSMKGCPSTGFIAPMVCTFSILYASDKLPLQDLQQMLTNSTQRDSWTLPIRDQKSMSVTAILTARPPQVPLSASQPGISFLAFRALSKMVIMKLERESWKDLPWFRSPGRGAGVGFHWVVSFLLRAVDAVADTDHRRRGKVKG